MVEDRRNGKQWKFENINFSLTRPREGGVAFALTSSGTDGPWSLTTTVAPRGNGRRAIEAVVRDLSPKDILLALRVDDGSLEVDVPLSGIVRAEIGADATVHTADGRMVAGAGFIGMPNAPQSRILLDETSVVARWDPANRVLFVQARRFCGNEPREPPGGGARAAPARRPLGAGAQRRAHGPRRCRHARAAARARSHLDAARASTPRTGVS